MWCDLENGLIQVNHFSCFTRTQSIPYLNYFGHTARSSSESRRPSRTWLGGSPNFIERLIVPVLILISRHRCRNTIPVILWLRHHCRISLMRLFSKSVQNEAVFQIKFTCTYISLSQLFFKMIFAFFITTQLKWIYPQNSTQYFMIKWKSPANKKIPFHLTIK